jgi:hypothetical protein
MTDTSLSTVYREYIDCLNRQDRAELGQFLAAIVPLLSSMVFCLPSSRRDQLNQLTEESL